MVYASGLLYDDNGCSIFWEDQFSGGIILLGGSSRIWNYVSIIKDIIKIILNYVSCIF